MKTSLCILMLIAITSMFAMENQARNRFSIFSDISEEQQLLETVWVPELSFSHELGSLSSQIELSVYSKYQSTWGESHNVMMDAEPYRWWLSLRSAQSEMRVGLQRINFGTAKILRPLQWFDQINPLDASQETTGVEAALLRQYWLNNTNLWLWAVKGESTLKGNEFLNSKNDSAEIGGRIQLPTPLGETAISYHQRTLSKGYEYRAGWDHRLDSVLGIWTETATSIFTDNDHEQKNNLSATLGLDYAIPIGNGIAVTLENMWQTDKQSSGIYSAVLLNYSLGLLDIVSTLYIYEWENNKSLCVGTWQRTYDYLALELSAKHYTDGDLSLMLKLSLNY